MNYFKIFSIMTVAVILLGLTSCKKGDTDPREITGTWNTMNKEDYNVEMEGGMGTHVAQALKNAKILPPTIVFNDDNTGSFVYSDKTTTKFTYIKLDNSIVITATGMKINKKEMPVVAIPMTYNFNDSGELHLVINALDLTKAYTKALGSPHDKYADQITKVEISCWYKK